MAVLHENVHGSKFVFARYPKLFILQTFAVHQICLFFRALSNHTHLMCVAWKFLKMHFGPKIGLQSWYLIYQKCVIFSYSAYGPSLSQIVSPVMIEKYWLLLMVWLLIIFLCFGPKIGHGSFFDWIFSSNLSHIPLHCTTKFQIFSYETFGDMAFQKLCPEEDKRIKIRIKIRWNFSRNKQSASSTQTNEDSGLNNGARGLIPIPSNFSRSFQWCNQKLHSIILSRSNPPPKWKMSILTLKN